MHPILKRVKPHNGLDLKPNRPGGRDRLIAPADNCRVVSRGTRGGYGKSLKLKCGAYEFFFAHLSSYKVKKGQAVKKGQVVGLMGTTGRSSGVHLHFETFKNGRRIDPLKVYGNNPKKLCDRVDKPKKKYGQKRSRKYQKSKKRNWRR